MEQEDVIKLYLKEREYQKAIFGDFKNNPSLNLASFISFLETYLQKVRNSYSDKWTSLNPNWLISCKESKEQGSAPVLSYENLIKVFALAGAALEEFAEVDFDKWREEGIKKKWIEP